MLFLRWCVWLGGGVTVRMIEGDSEGTAVASAVAELLDDTLPAALENDHDGVEV